MRILVRLFALASGSLAALVVANGAAACTFSGACTGDPPVCPCPPVNPCVVTTLQLVPAGATVDCSGRDMHIKDQFGRIEVENGFVTVLAEDVTIDTNHRIVATRTVADVPYGVRLDLTGKLDARGILQANSNLGGGTVEVVAAGDVLLPKGGTNSTGIEAKGTQADAPGGRVVIESGGNVLIDDPILANALESSATSVAQGGSVSVVAAGTITVAAKISAFGKQTQAGTISLRSRGDIDAAGNPLDPEAAVACGSPDQTGRIVVEANAPILAEGGNTNGNGGEIHLVARQISTASTLSAQGGLNVGGGSSRGGLVALTAGDCGLTLGADVIIRGGEAGSGLSAGALLAESDGDITVASGVKIYTRSEAGGGDGGDLSLDAGGDLVIQTGAQLDASGHTGGGNQGDGASIALHGCDVRVEGTAVVDAGGYTGGSVVLSARDTLTVSSSASVRADGVSSADDGEIVLHYRPGWCTADPEAECSTGTCVTAPAPGFCSNDNSRTCTVNADCTVGCQTGECMFGTCTNDDLAGCNTSAVCQNLGCASGACNVRYTTSPDTQFDPPAVRDEDPNLESCE